MKKTILRLTAACLLGGLFSFPPGCSSSSDTEGTIRHYPIENMEGLVDPTGIAFDKDVSSDGNGSLRIETTTPSTIRLYETGDVDVENARLEYRAMVKTDNFQGSVYLEMWCSFEGKGKYFSRDMGTPLIGSQDWSHKMTPFFLKKGENPENVRLNIIIEGVGTVWIDNIYLVQTALN